VAEKVGGMKKTYSLAGEENPRTTKICWPILTAAQPKLLSEGIAHMTLPRLLFSVLAILSLYSAAAGGAEPFDLYFIDAHSQADNEQVLQRAITLMDQAGVRRTILSARGYLTSGDIAGFAELHPDRITASVRTKGQAYDRNTSSYYQTLERDVGSGRFGAISELLMYHAQKGLKAPEVVAYPNDKRVQAALALARKNEWPLVLHIEFASVSEGAKIRFMEQLEAMLTQNPDHPFVMIHMGQLRAADVRRLIESHKNLYFMTSHTNPTAVSNSNQPWTPMFRGDVLASDWKGLVVQYPDRFVLAFDNVWPDHWGDFYLQEAQHWRKAFAALPGEVAHAIAHGNAERLWKIPKK
jgi:predicted TIM-barrel fold metal-dependent hydrolase